MAHCSRLLALEAQEVYYETILNRSVQCWVPESFSSGLDENFAALKLEDHRANRCLTNENLRTKENLILDQIMQHEQHEAKDISMILQAMRKLREAIVATGRSDSFAQGVYMFIVQVSILLRHVESYHPALLHLLNRMHPGNPLDKGQLSEMLGYRILDQACRQADANAASFIKSQLTFHDGKINQVLHAITRGDWVAFWKAENSANIYQQRLLEPAKSRIRQHAVECLGKAYLSVNVHYVEKITRMSWEALRNERQVKWSLEGTIVTIRQVKRK